MIENPNPMPEFKIFDPLKQIAQFVGRFSLLPNETFASHGDHFVKDRGAEAMLDAHLEYEQLEIDYDSKC